MSCVPCVVADCGKIAWVAATASCVAAGLMAVWAIAGATLNNTISPSRQPARTAYAVQQLNQMSESNTDLRQHNGVRMTDGSLSDGRAALQTQHPDPQGSNHPAQGNQQRMLSPPGTVSCAVRS